MLAQGVAVVAGQRQHVAQLLQVHARYQPRDGAHLGRQAGKGGGGGGDAGSQAGRSRSMAEAIPLKGLRPKLQQPQ